jgi:hypothetical protein
MKRITYLPLALFLTGCAFIHSTTLTDKQGRIVTHVTSYTLFDSQAALTKFQNRGTLTSSNEWSPGTSIGALNQQSQTTTNFNDLIGTVVKAAVQGAVTGAK